MRHIEKELEELSDMSDMKSAAIGGNTIRKIYAIDSLPYLDDVEKRVAKFQAKQQGEVEEANFRVDVWTNKSIKDMNDHIRELEKEADEEEAEAAKEEKEKKEKEEK